MVNLGLILMLLIMLLITCESSSRGEINQVRIGECGNIVVVDVGVMIVSSNSDVTHAVAIHKKSII